MRLARTTLAALLALAVAACADAPPAPTAATSAPVARAAAAPVAACDARDAARLERAADGLLYTSESDYPFGYVCWADAPAGAPSPDALRARFALPADAPVAEIGVAEFLARHTSPDPLDDVAQRLVPEYRRLERTIGSTLFDARVYRVGTVQVRCFILGRDAAGQLAGLETVAIET